MKMHPAEIAKDLKSYSFFKSFTDDLLLQISTMVREQTFPPDSYILKEGQKNNCLYFIRKGIAEVSLAGEVFAKLEKAGEVVGEMSVITSNPAATSVRTLVPTDAYVIDADDFKHVQPKDKDRLNALLYQIYCVILTERLAKTNEKARLFEVLNRELHEAQNALEKSGGGKVLLVEPERKQQVAIKMALGGTGFQLDIANGATEAAEFLNQNQYDVALVEESCIDVLGEVHKNKKARYAILLTSRNIQGNLQILKNHRYVEHLVSRDLDDRSSTIRYILTTLGKLLNKDLFGLEKYLSWGADVQKRTVTNSSQRESLREDMTNYFKKMSVRNSVLDRVNTVVEEMLMNAIYDAPVDSQGKSVFNHVSRKEEIKLDTHQQSQFKFASDGLTLSVSVTDPFGSLSKDIIIDYLLSCYSGQAGSLNTEKGGAGRGLHQIIENSDLTIFNVKKGVRTEVICLFYLDGQTKEPHPSFHYFFT